MNIKELKGKALKDFNENLKYGENGMKNKMITTKEVRKIVDENVKARKGDELMMAKLHNIRITKKIYLVMADYSHETPVLVRAFHDKKDAQKCIKVLTAYMKKKPSVKSFMYCEVGSKQYKNFTAKEKQEFDAYFVEDEKWIKNYPYSDNYDSDNYDADMYILKEVEVY